MFKNFPFWFLKIEIIDHFASIQAGVQVYPLDYLVSFPLSPGLENKKSKSELKQFLASFCF